MCNYLSSCFEIVFAVCLVLKFWLVSWQFNGNVKVCNGFGICSVLYGCIWYGDNDLLSSVAAWHQTLHASYLGSASNVRHAVYPHPPLPAYRTYRYYTGIKGIAPNDTQSNAQLFQWGLLPMNLHYVHMQNRKFRHKQAKKKDFMRYISVQQALVHVCVMKVNSRTCALQTMKHVTRLL